MKRRSLLRYWLIAAVTTGLSVPLLSFWTRQRYRPPIEKEVSKRLKVGQFVIEPRFVLFMTKKGPVAISRTCTHLGCRINYLEDKKIFLCPCHQSRFTSSGKYISGPAKKDLQKFPVKPKEDGSGYIVYLPR